MTKTKSILNISALAILVIGLSACSSMQQYQPLPPVKVVTEEVQLEIYQPPLPQAIQMLDVEWKVLTNTPCKPATGENKNPRYYTTEKYMSEPYTKEDGTESIRAVRDAEGKRIPREPLVDEDGEVIMVCGNLDQKIAEVEKMIGGDFVIMAVTPKGYENMAANLQDIKRYIKQQKEIILYYREATGANSDSKDEWLYKNEQQQDKQVEAAKADNEQQAAEISQSSAPAEENSGFSLSKLIPSLKKD